ncbi:MAG: chemotaxis protein CheD [Candidatus Heimdallarchaeota archaeon]|nr:MAG: chemotaxis protein CheD [Candidatus Heimdallarchaeota archaeon]
MIRQLFNKEKTGSYDSRTHYVGIGEVKLGCSNDQLKITSLGSCIGVVLYPEDEDPVKCAVMGHIMLPRSQGREPKKYTFGPTRFADIAIPLMVKKLEKAIGKHRRKAIVAKIIGGAEMFGYTKITLKIGEENAKVTKALLKDEKIPLIKEFTGGDTGMSVKFRVSDYLLTVKPTGGRIIII